ncbi:uncharacterized protein BDCG_06594 [Blastomyces dermatitidis ER-3]|uniref:Uncharacterized protein n=3 Tax=Blastomyces TaxID=229219 RepID=A0A179UQA7_BLAGS|nr:uncharacterized protein BDBG_05171 [Blastomyces gilchristii SLH14081]XP_031578795.1 hypothetical protein, variant [Blastomyces gilchristii SLH14081]XP_045278006.1 uncharacterized protein BDCG_06594 [Blastomyces dermatitidis ER-3]EGE80357.1 hypothetical protein BDDG_03298 [Blastomyces dermatitidis ATCC 18188]EQL32473.1 hypothetical protein BDFG_05347 [Blastomyces dermatitidis ATCC 26199]EEQ91474.2 hypothetical protein BDCG_06594 [Blastomyces dermatitidis ER-3]EQL32474.1 hypothetical protein
MVGLGEFFAAAKGKRKASGRRHKPGGSDPNQAWSLIPGIPNLVDLTAGVKDIWEGYNSERNGRVYRDEMRKTGDAVRQGIPSIQTCAQSLAVFFKRKNAFDLFSAFLDGLRVVAQFVEVLQGRSALEEIGRDIHRELQAQTGLKAPKTFAKQVYKVIRHQTSLLHEDGVPHFYFLYHPDTDWHGYFFDIVSQNPLPPNLLGVSENLDALCLWMIFLRQHLDRDDNRRARFHLIIPAYRPMLIKDPLIFPDKLFPLTVQGLKHDSKEYVWFNLPTLNDTHAYSLDLKDVGNIYQPPSNGQDAAAATTFAASTAGWIGITLWATSLAAPILAPFVLMGSGVSGMVGAVQATKHVHESFKQKLPRVLGQQRIDDDNAECGDGNGNNNNNNNNGSSADSTNQPVSAGEFTVQPGTHIVSHRRHYEHENRRRRRRRHR